MTEESSRSRLATVLRGVVFSMFNSLRGGGLGWVFVLLCGLILVRALPAFHRGTYATEGGTWLAEMWQIGFWKALVTIRPDYAVLGNLVVIKLADAITVWTSGSPLGAAGPFWQHALAAAYVALQFLLVYGVLKRHHGMWPALLATVVMLLAPDLDDENRIFGEANNVGFFSLLAVVFVYYDFWLTHRPSLRRSLGWLAVLIFHLLTSPLAGVVAAMFSILLLVKLGWQAWRGAISTREWLSRGVVFGIPILLAGSIIWRARQHGPSAKMATEAASGGWAALEPVWIDLVLCRQWFYPLTANFYLSASDSLTIGVFGACCWGCRSSSS